MSLEEVLQVIKETKSIKDKSDRLMELNSLAQDIANHFTESMSYLESEIQFVLDRTPRRIKDELGYYDVCDVTQDIIVTPSWGY